MFSRLASALTLVLSLVDGQFNNPPGVDIWCGKAYRDTYALRVRCGMATDLLTDIAMLPSTQEAGLKNQPSLRPLWLTSRSDLE